MHARPRARPLVFVAVNLGFDSWLRAVASSAMEEAEAELVAAGVLERDVDKRVMKWQRTLSKRRNSLRYHGDIVDALRIARG